MTDKNLNNYLPPVEQYTKSHGFLSIKPKSIIFSINIFSIPILKIKFWGQKQANYISVSQTQTYFITTGIKHFKTYLIDSNICEIDIIDNKDSKILGCVYLNWKSYLKPLDDIYPKQIKTNELISFEQTRPFYIPFYDQTMIQTLPIYKPRNINLKMPRQKIGQLNIQWSCRVYGQQPHPQTKISNKLIVSENELIKSQSIKNIQIKQSNFKLKTGKSFNNNIQDNILQKPQSFYSNNFKNNINSHSQFQKSVKYTHKKQPSSFLYKPNNHNFDIQLIRVRMEMEQLIGSKTVHQNTTLYIYHFQKLDKNILFYDKTYIDIRSQKDGNNNQWRVFPQSITQNRIIFNSAVVANIGSILFFTLPISKGKQTSGKGQININCISSSFSISIFSSQANLLGFLKVGSSRQYKQQIQQITMPQIPPILKIPEEKNQNKLKQNKITQNYINKTNDEIKNIKQYKQIKQQKKPQPASIKKPQPASIKIVLIVVEQYNGIKRNQKYKIGSMLIQGRTNNKFIIISQDELKERPIILSIFDDQLLISDIRITSNLKCGSIQDQNMTCSLLSKKQINNYNCACYVYYGNFQQINYFIQNLNKTNNIKPIPQKQHQFFENIENNKIQYKQNRKLKTQAIGINQRQKLLTQGKVSGQSIVQKQNILLHNQINQAQSQQNNQEDNIYLVDILTRFLQSLPTSALPNDSELQKYQFINVLCSKNQNNPNIQPQLVDIISTIFINQNGKVDINLLRQSHTAFQSFLAMYRQQKKQTISSILQGQPRAIQKIKAYSEMGIINESILWGRALSKINDISLRKKVNKFYKISSYTSTQVGIILQDLNNQNNILRSIDISNIGMIIREIVQKYISEVKQQQYKLFRQYLSNINQQDSNLNIINISYIFSNLLMLKMSYWQSIMIIQQIKANYGCDLFQQQGIISSNSLLQWSTGVRARARSSIHTSLNSSFSSDKSLISQIDQILKNNYT